MLDLDVAEATPHPTGTLVVPISCHTDPAHKRPAKHTITVHPDWTVDTGHDIQTERIAVALGGYLSCVDLVDKVIPAVRTYLQRQFRREVPLLKITAGGGWRPAKRVERCCAGSMTFESAMEGAEHLRTHRHVAAEHGARTTAVRSLAGKVLAAWGLNTPVPVPRDAMRLVGRCVDRPRDVYQLWEAGLRPDSIEAVYEAAAVDRPLTAKFYLGVLSNRPDLKWIRESAQQVPERDVHEWLAWSETKQDRLEPELRGKWLRLGVSRRDLKTLNTTSYQPSDVEQLARALRISTTAAAETLATWSEAGCQPEVSELITVCQQSDAGPSVVNRATVDRLAELLVQESIAADRREVAYALTLCGSPPIAARIVSAVKSIQPKDITRGLREWERERLYGDATKRRGTASA